MSSVKSISGVNFTAGTSSVTSANAQNEGKNSKSSNKLLIGAGAALALGGTILGGIMYAKKAKFNKALDKILAPIKDNISKIKKDDFFTSKFDLSKVDDELAEVIKEAKKTKNLDGIKGVAREYQATGLFMKGETTYSMKALLEKADSEPAKALQKMVDEKGDFTQARRLYMDSAKEFHYKTNVDGYYGTLCSKEEQLALFAEKNLVSADVKPHTYNLAEEMDVAVLNYNSGSGYTDYMLRGHDGLIERCSYFSDDAFGAMNHDPIKIPSKTINRLVSSYRSPKCGVDVVSLKLPNAGKLKDFEDAHYFIGVGSKTGNLTQFQKDLIEVGGRLNDDEIMSLAKLINEKRYMNYDVLLSQIQHYANNAEFMARPIK